MNALLAILLQVAPPCITAAPLPHGASSTCTGGVLVPQSQLDKLGADFDACEVHRKADASAAIVRQSAQAASKRAMDALIRHMGEVYGAALDRALVRVAVAPRPEPESYWSRPGWPTVVVGIVATGAVTWMVVR